jgi:hypothetical protein
MEETYLIEIWWPASMEEATEGIIWSVHTIFFGLKCLFYQAKFFD